MKIEIGEFTLIELGDGAALEISTGTITRLVDETAPLDAAEITTWFRGGRRSEIRFTISRPAASPDAALGRWFAHEAEVPVAGPLRLTSSDGSVVIEVPGHLRELGLPRRHGTRLWHEYLFVGGRPRVSVVDPESGETWDEAALDGGTAASGVPDAESEVDGGMTADLAANYTGAAAIDGGSAANLTP